MALHEGVGGSADRIPKQSRLASSAGATLMYSWKKRSGEFRSIGKRCVPTSEAIWLVLETIKGDRILPSRTPKKLPEWRACVTRSQHTIPHFQWQSNWPTNVASPKTRQSWTWLEWIEWMFVLEHTGTVLESIEMRCIWFNWRVAPTDHQDGKACVDAQPWQSTEATDDAAQCIQSRTDEHLGKDPAWRPDFIQHELKPLLELPVGRSTKSTAT